MSEVGDFNAKVIEEFRANRGRVGGMFEGTPIVLLITAGARTGRRRTTPLAYLPGGDRLYVFGSKGGAPTHPDWYHNLVAHPEVTIEVGADTREATATVITGEERGRIFAEMVAARPQFGEYARATTRTIPVVALDPTG